MHELARQPAVHGFSPEALRAYEAVRVDYMKRIASNEWVSGPSSFLLSQSATRTQECSQACREDINITGAFGVC